MKILLRGTYATSNANRLRAALEEAADLVCCEIDMPAADFARALDGAEAAVAMRWGDDVPATAALRLLQLPGAGVDGIDLAQVPASCAVCNVHGHETPISEYVVLGMLEWCIGMRGMDAELRQNQWTQGVTATGNRHQELAGKTVGIVGYGHIGRAVGARAAALGVRVVAITRTRPDDLSGLADWVVPDRLDEVLPGCDFVVLCCPLTPATEGLFDATRLARMNAGAVLINVARAAIVVEGDLYEALAAATIGGAILDVWYRYPRQGAHDGPPATCPFADLPNVIMTPHASGWTEGTVERRWALIADNINRLARGAPLLNVIGHGTAGP